MTIYYLKFKDESEAKDILCYLPHIEIDMIGEIFKPTNNTITNDDGIVSSIMEALDGYFVNIKGNLSFLEEQALTGYFVFPKTPMRTWAGD